MKSTVLLNIVLKPTNNPMVKTLTLKVKLPSSKAGSDFHPRRILSDRARRSSR